MMIVRRQNSVDESHKHDLWYQANKEALEAAPGTDLATMQRLLQQFADLMDES